MNLPAQKDFTDEFYQVRKKKNQFYEISSRIWKKEDFLTNFMRS